MSIKELTKNFRKNQTEAEKLFWNHVKNRKFEGKKFLRQHPIYFELEGVKRFFVADFYCAEAKIIIEIDGKIHENQKEYDEYRAYILNNLGYKIVRFKNFEVLHNFPSVIKKLESYF